MADLYDPTSSRGLPASRLSPVPASGLAPPTSTEPLFDLRRECDLLRGSGGDLPGHYLGGDFFDPSQEPVYRGLDFGGGAAATVAAVAHYGGGGAAAEPSSSDAAFPVLVASSSASEVSSCVASSCVTSSCAASSAAAAAAAAGNTTVLLPPPLPRAPFALRATHVRFHALTTTPKTTMSLDWMHLIHAELARLGADLSAASREGVLTPFKRHGVVYVDQAAVHFKVKMWASSSSSSSSSSSEAHEEGSTTGERDGVVCEFTKRRGDSFLWNHFFRHARNAIQRAAGKHVVRGGEGSGSDGNKGEGGNGGEGGEGGTEASGDSSAAPRPQIAPVRENTVLVAAMSPQHVPSPMLPVNDADFAANVAPSSSSSSVSDQRNGINNNNTTTAATTEEDTRQALAAVRELTHTVVQFAAGGEATVSDTTSDSLASTLAILTNVCQRQAQKQSGLQPRRLSQPPSNLRGRPGGDTSAASASVAVSDSTPTSESASASGWAVAGRTLCAGTVDAVLAVEHVAALERILREQRCPDTSRCAAALVGSSATLARVVMQQAQTQTQERVVVVVEEGGGGQGKGERPGGGTGGETSEDGGKGGQGGSRSQDGTCAGAGSIAAGADTGARCLLSIVPALLSQLQQSEQLPSLSMLQCRRDCVGALGALSALGPDCTFMKLVRCAPP